MVEAYDPVVQITNLTRLNGVKADYGYDPIGQLISAQAFESGGTPRLNEQFGYGYDASHNLATRTNNTLIQTFTSNAKDELASVVRAGTLTVSGSVTGAVTSVGVNGTQAAIYSDQTFATTSGLTLNDGNNLFVTAGSNSSGTLVVSTKHATKLPVTVSPVYDLNGNLLSDGLKGFDYDDANQLVRVTVPNQWKSEFTYDALGRRRISKDYTWSGAAWTVTNEVRYVWDGMAVLQERDGANVVKVTYTRGLDLSGTMQGAGGIGGLLARTDTSGTTFYHSDAGGNITAMTDSSGNVVARYLYDPYGNLLAKSGSMADINSYRFSSKEVHPNSGLYYYGYRFYEPNLQRWPNQDPIGIAGGMNTFGFVQNNPLTFYDLFGLRLPDIDNGQWSGEWGNSEWTFKAGCDAQKNYPKAIKFVNGVPDYKASGYALETITLDTPPNRAMDSKTADKMMGDGWKRPKDAQWHHFNRNGKNELQLVKGDLHRKTAHDGPVAEFNRKQAAKQAEKCKNLKGKAAAFAILGIVSAMQGANAETLDKLKTDVEAYAACMDSGGNCDLPDLVNDITVDVNDLLGAVVATRVSGQLLEVVPNSKEGN